MRRLNFLPSGGLLSVKQGIVTIRRAFFKHHSRCSEEDGGGPARTSLGVVPVGLVVMKGNVPGTRVVTPEMARGHTYGS